MARFDTPPAKMIAGVSQQNFDAHLAENVQYKETNDANILDLQNNKAGKTEVNALATDKANQVDLVAETVNRQAEVAVERARIDSFTALTAGSTTGDAELIDGRTGADGVTYSNIGGSIRGQFGKKVDKSVIYFSQTLANDVNTFNGLNIPLDDGVKKYVKITNGSASSGYFDLLTLTSPEDTSGYWTGNLVNSGASFTAEILNRSKTISSISVKNTNNRSNCKIEVYGDYNGVIPTHVKQSLRAYEHVYGSEEATHMAGVYINTSGKLVNASGRTTAILNNIKTGDRILLTAGETSWNCLWGYKDDGTAVRLTSDNHVFNNEIYIVNDDSITMLKAFAADSERVVSMKKLPSLPSHSPTVEIVVAKDGSGDFTNINDACTYAKAKYDLQNIPVTIYVRNGKYTVTPVSAYPYAAINKGANRISIIGESRDGVIIEMTSSNVLDNKILDIGGPCTIANLTIKHYATTLPVSGSHNPYCIHNDTAFTSAEEYLTVVENCYLYSEAFNPVGAGVRDHQKQIYRNVVCDFNGQIDGYKQWGALYVHGPQDTETVANMSLEIDSCTCIAKNGTQAICLPNTTSPVQYTAIPVSIRRTIGVTDGATITNVSKATHKITSDSALNNVSAWNY